MSISYERTPDGVSAQVYCLNRGAAVFYLRIAEEPGESLAIDAELLRHLRRLGVRVPEPMYVESFDPVIGRSILITTEVPGRPLSPADLPSAASVARAAGRNLAILNQVPVQGFGWIRRDRPDWPLTAELQTYSEFVTSYLPDDWPRALSTIFSPGEIETIESIIHTEKQGHLPHGQLAHGDFDVTPIFQHDGVYTGLIDFGEIRGAEPFFDLGHFYVHDGETFPVPLLDHLLDGYQDVARLPADYMVQISRSAMLLGLRQLCRWISAERRLPLDHPRVTHRAKQLSELLGQDGR